MTTPFWLNNPTILFDKYSLTQIWPTPSMDPNKKLNAITRMVILMSFVGFLITNNKRILITCIITLIAIVVLQHIQQGSITQANFNKPQKEGFEMLNERQLDQLNSTKPTNTNPIMNVLLPEIQNNPTRPAAEPAYNPIVEKDINAKTREFVVNQFDNKEGIEDRLFKDLGDEFEFDKSMHQWYATPNTTVPNDQKSFAEFCYGGMTSCKEGNELACTNNTPPHWINGNK